MKIHKHFLFFLIFILHSTFYILHSPLARAEGLSLSISHSLIHAQADSPSDTKYPITIENPGDNSLNILILLKPFRASRKENGQIEYLKDNEIPDKYKNIFKQIHVTDNGIALSQFQLGPMQKKNLELQFTIPKNEASSDYYFSVIFLARRNSEDSGLTSQNNEADKSTLVGSENNQEQNITRINAGIALNVILTVGNQNQPQAAIEEFSAPSFIKSGPVSFTVRVKNIGPRVFAPKGIIFINNMFGQTVGRVDLQPDKILSGSIRALNDIRIASTSASSNFSSRKAIWPENLLLGPYTATLNLAVSDKGPIYKQSVVFLALPLQLILGIIFGIIITTTIFFRVRYHIKND